MGSCADCDRSGPNQGEERKRDRGCPLAPWRFHLSDPPQPYTVDYTGDPARDRVAFCPIALADPRVEQWVYRVIELEPQGGLAAYTKRGLAHLPRRVPDWYARVIAARDRLNADVDDALADLLEREAQELAGGVAGAEE